MKIYRHPPTNGLIETILIDQAALSAALLMIILLTLPSN
jgi:hypothetical protein